MNSPSVFPFTDHVECLVAVKCLLQLDDVGVFDHLQHSDLHLQRFGVLWTELALIDAFDCPLRAIVLVYAFLHCGKASAK